MPLKIEDLVPYAFYWMDLEGSDSDIRFAPLIYLPKDEHSYACFKGVDQKEIPVTAALNDLKLTKAIMPNEVS